MEEAAAKIIADTHISSLTEAASWAPRWKVVANVCLVVENVLVLIGLVLIFGRDYLDLSQTSVSDPGSFTTSSGSSTPSSTNGTTWLPSSVGPGEVSSSGDEGVWAYVGGALVLFSRLIHTIGLLASAQSKGHLQSLSTSKLTDLRHIQEDA